MLLKIFNLFIIGNQDILRCTKRKLFDNLDSTLTQHTEPSVSSSQKVNCQYIGSPEELKLHTPSKKYKATRMNTSPSLYFRSSGSSISSMVSSQTKVYVQDLIELPSPRNSEHKNMYVQNADQNLIRQILKLERIIKNQKLIIKKKKTHTNTHFKAVKQKTRCI